MILGDFIMGIRGPQPQPNAISRTGWRPPLLPGTYQDLVFAIFRRPEFQGASTRSVLEAALKAFATEEELDQSGLDA